MKILTFLLGFIFAFATLTNIVEAYGIYGGYSLPSYSENTDFYKNFDLTSFTGSSSFQQTGDQFTDLQELYQNSGNSGFSNAYLQNFLQDVNLDVNSGYDFTKGPCVKETINGNFKGKSNDFTITREVCDNIQGTFFKNNQYSNSLSNGASLSNAQFGTNAYDNQYSNQNTYNNQQSTSLSQQQQALSVSFGKGTRIILN